MSDNELKVLFNEETEITVKGEIIIIKPLGLGQIPKAIGFIQRIAEVVGDISQEDLQKPETVVKIMSLGGEEVIGLLAFVLKKDRVWFDDLPTDKGLEIIASFIEANIGFFLQKCLPLLNKYLEKSAQAGLK